MRKNNERTHSLKSSYPKKKIMALLATTASPLNASAAQAICCSGYKQGRGAY